MQEDSKEDAVVEIDAEKVQELTARLGLLKGALDTFENTVGQEEPGETPSENPPCEPEELEVDERSLAEVYSTIRVISNINDDLRSTLNTLRPFLDVTSANNHIENAATAEILRLLSMIRKTSIVQEDAIIFISDDDLFEEDSDLLVVTAKFWNASDDSILRGMCANEINPSFAAALLHTSEAECLARMKHLGLKLKD